MARNRIAEAYIELRAEGASKTKAAIGAVTNEVKELKRGGDAALGRLADKMTEATEGAAKLQGAIGAVLGVFVAVAGAAFKLGNAIFQLSQNFRDASVQAREFYDSLENPSAENAQANLDAIDAKLLDINSRIADMSTLGRIERLFLGGEERLIAIRDELNQIRSRIKGPLDAAEAERQRQAQASREAAAEAARAQNDALRAAELRLRAAGDITAEEKARLELEALSLERQQQIIDNIREIDAARADENDALADALRDRARLLEDIYNNEAARIRKNRDDAIQAEKEKADARAAEQRRAARETAAANASAIQQTAQAQIDAARSINDAVSAFSDIKNLIASLDGAVQEIRGRLP